VSQAGALQGCAAAGGLLLAWYQVGEQAEVERAFISSGRLLPDFHGAYWLGLTTTTPLASFRWAAAAVWHVAAC
jgi:hypothetical protein